MIGTLFLIFLGASILMLFLGIVLDLYKLGVIGGILTTILFMCGLFGIATDGKIDYNYSPHAYIEKGEKTIVIVVPQGEENSLTRVILDPVLYSNINVDDSIFVKKTYDKFDILKSSKILIKKYEKYY